MKLFLKRGLLLAICLVLAATSVSVSAGKADLQNDIAKLEQQSKALDKDIKDLKAKKADQQAIVNALQKKISNTQAQIRRCNTEINSINAKIAANKAEIDANNKKIEKSKLEFKKRIRAIYMSNSDSNVRILLGSESFSDYLQLSQLTAAVSSHDKAIIEDIVGTIEKINAKNAENEKLLESQVAVKNTILAQQKALEADEAEASGLLSDIAGEQKSAEQDKAQVEAEIKAKEDELQRVLNSASSSAGSFVNAKSGFMWPVPGYMGWKFITSKFGYRKHPITGKNKLHAGVDIAGASIFQKKIVAITDGVVTYVYNSCGHTDKPSRCSHGGGYGNYVIVDHGEITIDGKTNVYSAYYAHMDSVAVKLEQKVKQGDTLGYVGTTGQSTGYHLHFGLIRGSGWVDPMNYF